MNASRNSAPSGDTPTPNDGAFESLPPPDIALSVNVDDPNGDNVDVYFYEEDGTPIDQAFAIPTPGSPTVAWTGLGAGTYRWYAVVYDGEFGTATDTWEFTIP